MSAGLKLTQVGKRFDTESGFIEVLRDVSLELKPGESLTVTGPSGVGKSTLLHIIGTLEPPTSGAVEIDGRDPFALSEPELARFRNKSVGFVFQDHHLLPQYSVLENILLPALAFGDGGRAAPRARELAERVGLAHRLEHRPGELSGGERQRVAVARALILGPSLLLCDEPTGSLDPKTATSIADLLFELQGDEGNMMIVVTHSQELAERFERRLTLG